MLRELAGRRFDREQPEVLEKGAAGFALGKDGEDAHATATGVAAQDIDGECYGVAR